MKRIWKPKKKSKRITFVFSNLFLSLLMISSIFVLCSLKLLLLNFRGHLRTRERERERERLQSGKEKTHWILLVFELPTPRKLSSNKAPPKVAKRFWVNCVIPYLWIFQTQRGHREDWFSLVWFCSLGFMAYQPL